MLLQNTLPFWDERIDMIADSLAELHRMDSIREVAVDSIALLAKTPTGFVGIPLPDALHSNPIVALSLLVLFFLFSYALTNGKKMILETTKDFFYLKERSSIFIESTAKAIPLRISFLLISIGTISLFLFSLYFHADTTTPFEEKMQYLGLFLLITGGFFLFKLISFHFLSFVFLDNSTSQIFTKGYFTILFGLGIALFPVIVGLIYTPDSFFFFFLYAGVFLFLAAFLLILYKIFQIFLLNLYSLFYIILYLCALEILPVLLVLKVLG